MQARRASLPRSSHLKKICSSSRAGLQEATDRAEVKQTGDVAPRVTTEMAAAGSAQGPRVQGFGDLRVGKYIVTSTRVHLPPAHLLSTARAAVPLQGLGLQNPEAQHQGHNVRILSESFKAPKYALPQADLTRSLDLYSWIWRTLKSSQGISSKIAVAPFGNFMRATPRPWLPQVCALPFSQTHKSP